MQVSKAQNFCYAFLFFEERNKIPKLIQISYKLFQKSYTGPHSLGFAYSCRLWLVWFQGILWHFCIFKDWKGINWYWEDKNKVGSNNHPVFTIFNI